MKEKGKTKSEKVRMSLLFAFSLLLFTSAANAAGQGPVEGYYAVDETVATRFSVDDVRAVNRNPTADEIAAADAAINAAGGAGPKLEMPLAVMNGDGSASSISCRSRPCRRIRVEFPLSPRLG